MYDRADGRLMAKATQEPASFVDERNAPQEREVVESGFRARFISALASAREAFADVDQEESLETIIETREFQEVYQKMKADLERGYRDMAEMRDDKPLDVWEGRYRLAEQTRLIIGAPILMQAYYERVHTPEVSWPPSPAKECRSSYNYGANTREAFTDLFSPNFNYGIRTMLRSGYEYGNKGVPRIDVDHPVAREADIIAQMYFISHSNVEGMSAPVTPFDGTDDELKAILAVSSWLAPLLAEWQTASHSEVSGPRLDTFFEYFTKRYGVPPRVTREQMIFAMDEGRHIYGEDVATVSAHEQLANKAEKMRDAFRGRQELDRNELGSVRGKIHDAHRALKNWELATTAELDKVDQRDVLRYSGSQNLLRERPEIQRASEQRFDLFNTFPDKQYDEHEDTRTQIQLLTRERAQLIKERGLSVRSKTREMLQSRIDRIDAKIDSLTESSTTRFQSQQEGFMKTMIAAEQAEKDLPLLQARQETLMRRLERYEEAIQEQQRLVDEEDEIINHWHLVSRGWKPRKEPQKPPLYSGPAPGYYMDQALGIT